MIQKGARRFYASFIEPLSLDEDARRREYILNVLLVGSIVMLVILDATAMYHALHYGSAYHQVSPFVFGILPVFFILLYAISRKGHFTTASYLLIAAYFASNSYAAYHWGINLPTSLISYALIILMSSILVGTAFSVGITVLTALFIIPVWYFQIHGVIPTQPQLFDDTDAVTFSVLYFLTLVVCWLSNREIDRSLGRARRSESELKRERDMLEVTIAKRTEELHKAQFEKMKQLYRFAEFGQLASGMFHDILNLLNAVALRREATQSETAAKTAKQVENFIQGMRKQLDHREIRETFSIVDGIEQVIQLILYKAHAEGVRIMFHHDPEGQLVTFGNPFKFHQLIINLIINAIESYESIPKDPSANRIVTVAATRENRNVVIRVEDHGCGIPFEIQDKIFELFFTTKDSKKGLGIGLPSVKSIVENDFKGSIRLESQPGEGSVFVLIIPIETGAR
ncbi:MAG TPA: HAMP domain-containing sensor histidine kinase [Candidatus Paceibacterota bacterium]|nr:HAMP domain-containing sensor histidine kinase [Candidatus Paceibacterota bacterium]